MKLFIIGATALAALALPALSMAATYQYVNTQGALESETANTAEQALTQPTDIAPDSGVILVSDTVVTNQSSTENSVDGTYSAQLTGLNTAARTMYLTLSPDGTVILSSLYNSSTPTMVEMGTWTGSGNNQIQVTLTSNASETYSPAQVIDFNVDGSTLTATNYSSSVYGTQGLTFAK